jgi:hypothetical protein
MLRGSYRPGHNQPGRGFGGGGRSPFPGGRNPGYPQQTGGYTHAPPSTTRPAVGGFTVTCFACGKPGHKSYECPDKKAATTPTRAPAPGGRPPQAAPPPAAGRGRLNHLTEEEAVDAPDVVIGKFLVCGASALVLNRVVCYLMVREQTLPPYNHPINSHYHELSARGYLMHLVVQGSGCGHPRPQVLR